MVVAIRERMEVVGTVGAIAGPPIRPAAGDSGFAPRVGHRHFISGGRVAGIEGARERLSAARQSRFSPTKRKTESKRAMPGTCEHLDTVRVVTPSALGCEDCLKTGDEWVHLRLCRSCGHVGCCDDSLNRHARKHFESTGHSIIEGYDPPEGWGWCFVDAKFVRLPSRTPQRGPIPKFV